MEEIGEQLHVTRERVRQREESAMEALGRWLIREYGKEVLPWSTREPDEETSSDEGTRGDAGRAMTGHL